MKKQTLLYLSLLLLVSACSQHRMETGNVVRVARAGSDYLTLKEASQAIPDFILKQDSIRAIKRYRKEWLKRQLMLKNAAKMNLATKKTVKQRLQQARRQVLISALREAVLAKYEKENKITDRQVLQFYQSHKETLKLKERYVRFRHLTAESAKKARAARQKLLSGASWPAVARSYSKNAKLRIKQSKKYWAVSMVLNNWPVLEQYIAALDSTEISPVRRLHGSYHFVQLMGARAAGKYPKPNWIVDRLKEWMMRKRKQQFFNLYIKNLYLDAKQNNEIELYNVLKIEKPKIDSTETN